MQPATDEIVLGDFGGTQFEIFGATTRFFRKGDDFLINTEGLDGRLHDYKVGTCQGL